ncbi:hypothetical protein GCM10010099_22770 [Streptomyces cinereus]|nr:hypothetical protein GCM10010099_22770 [Streptomyces cinereus]
MARKILSGRSYSPADGSSSPSFRVERDPSHGSFDSREEAEAWRDRLDDPDDLGPTAARASG